MSSIGRGTGLRPGSHRRGEARGAASRRPPVRVLANPTNGAALRAVPSGRSPPIDLLRPVWWYRFHDGDLRLSWRAQARLHWRANLAMLRTPRAVIGFTVVSLVPCVAWIVAAELLARLAIARPGGGRGLLTGDARLDAYLLLAPLYLLAQHVAFMHAMARWYVPFVRRALPGMGHPVCVACGHLTVDGAGSGRCPECGAAGQAEPDSPGP